MLLHSPNRLKIIAIVASLLACTTLRDASDASTSSFFWCVQVLFLFYYALCAISTLRHWDNSASVSKPRYLLSMLGDAFLYALAFISSGKATWIIFMIGFFEIYISKKRAGVLKSRLWDCN